MSPMKPQPRQAAAHLAGTLSITQAARRLGISTKVVRRMLRSREMQFEQITGLIRIPESEVKHFETTRNTR